MQPRILVFSDDTNLIEALENALGSSVHILFHPAAQIDEALSRTSHHIYGVIADARDLAAPVAMLGALLRAKRLHGSLKCVMFARLPEPSSDRVGEALRQAMPAVLVLDSEPLVSLAVTHLGDPSGTASAARAHSRLLQALPRALWPLLDAGFRIGPAHASVGRLARHLRVARQTLVRHHRDLHLPTPKVVLDPLVALYAVELRVGAGWRIKRIAAHLRYSDPADFRALIHRVFHVAPSGVSPHGTTRSPETLLRAWAVAHLVHHERESMEASNR